jgi:membrane fusion protein (multidrug efflux system)
VATNPQSREIILTQPYVCQIHSQRHIKIRALERGYLEAIQIKEGQKVREGDLLFKVIPILYQKRADAEIAEAKLAQLEYNYTKSLFEKKVVSENEVNLLGAKLAKADAKADLAKAELNFATVKAPFDGIVDRLHHQQGSLVEEGEILSTLSDNSLMWVYFNVPEARYLEYMADMNKNKEDLKIELMLANGSKFEQLGKIGAIEADFNNENGNIPFRADFSNPDRLLRHGQTGTVVLSRVQKDAIVIPQRATFEVLQKRYVYIVDKDNVAHQREIVIQNELEDIFVIKDGLSVDDTIVLEGIRQVRDGDKVEFEDRKPEQVAANLKFHAE